MGWRVEITEKADSDLEDIVSFLAGKSPGAAERIGLNLVSQIFLLSEFPERGISLKKRIGVRMLTYRDYRIIYQTSPEAGAVRIIRVWDSRKNPSHLVLD